MDLGETVLCAGCKEEVMPVDRVRAVQKAWHKLCFKCAHCATRLTLGKEMVHAGHPYCKKCYDAGFRVGQGTRI